MNVPKEVELSIERKILEYKRYKYDVGYKCQNGMLNTVNDNSYIAKIEFPVSKNICDKCLVSKQQYVDKRICWVGEEYKNIILIIAFVAETCETRKKYMVF